MISPAEVAAVECAELEGECEAFGEQVAQAPAHWTVALLAAQLDAAKAAGTNFSLIAKLGQAVKAPKVEAVQLPLSQEDYLTFAAKRAALVQRMEDKCRELVIGEYFHLLASLSDKLTAMQTLDIIVLCPSYADPVWVETPVGIPTPAL